MKGSGSLLAAALLACAPTTRVVPPFEPLPEPPPSEVAAVLLLVGDAGDAAREVSPLLHRLRADVERLSETLPPDRPVAVAFLGDNVYPEGIRDRDDASFARDSALLAGQVWTLTGPAAQAHRARGLFLAGNHDWGNLPGGPGLPRLRNMEALLARLASSGPHVELVPEAGEPGPAIVDLGSAAQLVILDTPWWLQAYASGGRADEVVDEIAAVLAGARDRPSIVLAHHPYASGGPHGGRRLPLTPEWLLHKAGALVQDLNSEPYRRLRAGLGDAFERGGTPLIFAGGHDHSLQVHEGGSAREPTWMLVSGAGSHVTPVKEVESLVWSAPLGGYMRLVFRVGGGIDLHVVAASPDVLECSAGPDAGRCVEQGIAAFRIVYATRVG